MPASRVMPYRNPLDVLWRGVPTLLRAVANIAGVRVTVETNDLLLLEAARAREASADATGESEFLWRIVRDEDAAGTLGDGVSFSRDELGFVSMGAALTVAVDRGRKELLAFVGGEVDDDTLCGTAMPLFERMTLDACAPRPSAAGESSRSELGQNGRDA